MAMETKLLILRTTSSASFSSSSLYLSLSVVEKRMSSHFMLKEPAHWSVIKPRQCTFSQKTLTHLQGNKNVPTNIHYSQVSVRLFTQPVGKQTIHRKFHHVFINSTIPIRVNDVKREVFPFIAVKPFVLLRCFPAALLITPALAQEEKRRKAA